MNKNKYLVLFDNCVTDDLLVEIIYAENYEECWRTAYGISCKSGYSKGNFEVFESVDQRMARETMAEMEAERNTHTIKLSGNMVEIPIEPKEGDVNPVWK